MKAKDAAAAERAADAEGGAHEQGRREEPRARARRKSCRSCPRSSNSGATRSSSSPPADAPTWPTRNGRRSRPRDLSAAGGQPPRSSSGPSPQAIAETGASRPEGHGQGHEGGDGAPGRQDGRWQEGERSWSRRNCPEAHHALVTRFFRFLTTRIKHFGGFAPSIHFERPSQPLTILLRAPAAGRGPFFCQPSSNTDKTVSSRPRSRIVLRIRVALAPASFELFACSTLRQPDARGCSAPGPFGRTVWSGHHGQPHPRAGSRPGPGLSTSAPATRWTRSASRSAFPTSSAISSPKAR